MYTDKMLTCADCGSTFPFTAKEQAFYAEKGFTSEPRRCPSCRAARKADRGDGGAPRGARPAGGPRELHTVICSSCGVETQVPFKPSGDRPVYCRDCFRK
jgi:CxxC-x17-CxxC domain-containing protein